MVRGMGAGREGSPTQSGQLDCRPRRRPPLGGTNHAHGPKKKLPDQPEVPLYFGLSPNQVVAYNLAQARLLRGWTQDQAAEALEAHVGARWSKATFSAAERSVDGERVRQFDADEIVAFARAFDLPVNWFFLPPPPWAAPACPPSCRHPPRDASANPSRCSPTSSSATTTTSPDGHAAARLLRPAGPQPAQRRPTTSRTWSPPRKPSWCARPSLTSRTGRPRCARSPTNSKTSPCATHAANRELGGTG